MSGQDRELSFASVHSSVELARAVRHEALNVLEECQLNLELLDRRFRAAEDERGRSDVALVAERLARLAKMLGTLGEVPGLGAGSSEEPQPVDASIAFDDAAEVLEGRLKVLGVTVDRPRAPIVVRADRDVLKIVFLQLLLGSLESFGAASQVRGRRIALSVGPQRDRGALLYADNGPRIVAEGLGLHMARNALRSFGGSITLVPSRVGAAFRIELPRNP